MKKFNENPFKKNTPVIPFSNGTDFEIWITNNCENCIYNENTSTKVEDAKCKLSFFIALSTGTGTIPLEVAKEIGCDYNPLYQTCRLSEKCRVFNDGGENNPF